LPADKYPMSDYVIAIKQDSPIWNLYQKLKADGVSDADLDTGYLERDNAKKTRKTVNQGDQKIEEPEILNYALEHYERYQLAIKETTGYIVPWSLDDLDPSTDFDEEIRYRADRTISGVKQVLSAKGLKEGSDEYNELLAVSLFAFARAPKPKLESGIYTTAVIPKYISRELEKQGLKEVTDQLARHGGLARSMLKKDCAQEAPALTALAKRCGHCSEESYILYGLFKRAGLKAKMFFVRPNHVAIGLPLGKRTRLFDLFNGISNAGPFFQAHNTPVWSEQSEMEFLSYYYNNLGGYQFDQGNFRSAVDLYKKALTLNPYSALVRKNLAQAIDDYKHSKNPYVY
jgi:hypothetical protein